MKILCWLGFHKCGKAYLINYDILYRKRCLRCGKKQTLVGSVWYSVGH